MPTIRASFGRRDALHLVDLLAREDAELRTAARDRLESEGVDALLDDPRVLNALLTHTDVSAPPELIFYVMIRHALLEAGVDDRGVADYVASMVVAFGEGRRAYRLSESGADEFTYMVDMVVRLSGASAREAFLIRTHLGNYALWVTGLFPDWVEARTRRRGAPGADYYARLGSAGFRIAAGSREADALGVGDVLDGVGTHFDGARLALNRVADRYLWRSGNPIGRLLRSLVPAPQDR